MMSADTIYRITKDEASGIVFKISATVNAGKGHEWVNSGWSLTMERAEELYEHGESKHELSNHRL